MKRAASLTNVSTLRTVSVYMLVAWACRPAMSAAAETGTSPTPPTSTKPAAFPPMSPEQREALLRASKDVTRPLADRTRDEIKAVLSDPNAPSRNRVGKIIDADDLRLRDMRPYLEAAREDRDPAVRDAAAIVLRRWDEMENAAAQDAKAREEIRRIQEMTPQQRRELRKGRRGLIDQEDAKISAALGNRMMEKLRHTKPEERLEAAATASTWGKSVPEALQDLCRMARADPDPKVRYHAALSSFMLLGDSPSGLSFLRECVAPQFDRPVRGMAAARLAHYGCKDGLTVQMELLGSSTIPEEQHAILRSIRGSTRLNTQDLNPGGVLSRSEIADEDRPLVEHAVTAWQKWWKEEGAKYVLPTRQRARSTRPSSEPASRRHMP